MRWTRSTGRWTGEGSGLWSTVDHTHGGRKTEACAAGACWNPRWTVRRRREADAQAREGTASRPAVSVSPAHRRSGDARCRKWWQHERAKKVARKRLSEGFGGCTMGVRACGMCVWKSLGRSGLDGGERRTPRAAARRSGEARRDRGGRLGRCVRARECSPWARVRESGGEQRESLAVAQRRWRRKHDVCVVIEGGDVVVEPGLVRCGKESTTRVVDLL